MILRKYTPVEFTIIKSIAMIPSRSLQCRAFSRAVIEEKSLSPLFPIGVGWGEGERGAVVPNDWFITKMFL